MLPPKFIGRIPLSANSGADRDFVMRWSVAGSETQFGSMAYRSGDDGYFAILMQPLLEPPDPAVTPREITFIMDVSGSMNGLPVDVSKELVRRCIDRLRPHDIFNIVYFASGNGQLWDSPQPPTSENLAKAWDFLKRAEGSGGTEMMAGLRRALAAKHEPQFLQMYLFLTDGQISEEASILQTIRENNGAARFFAFGIGSSVNRYLIDGIGELGGGFSQVVIPQDRSQGELAVKRFFAAVDSPVLVDATIDWNGLPVDAVYPRRLRDLYAGQTISLVGKYSAPVNGAFYVNGRVGDRPVRYEVQISLAERDETHASIAYLWGRQRIHELSKSLRTADAKNKKSLVSRITDTALKYGLVSDYTAFVAVDDSRIVGNGGSLRVVQPVASPAGVSQADCMSAVEIEAWGLTFQMQDAGSIVVASVDERGAAALSGIKAGDVLRSINHTALHDIDQLESVLLQAASGYVQLELDGQRPVELPRP